MPAYIANHEKKKRIFAKRECELLHAIKHNFADEKLLVMVEKVRAARIAVFKCRYVQDNEKQPHSFSAEKVAEENQRLARWLAMSTDEIVAMYRRELERRVE